MSQVLRERQTNDHLSVMAAITTQGKLYTLARQESLTGLHTIVFLAHLLRRIQSPMLLVWDRSPIHRRAEVRDFLARVGQQRLWTEFLPPYAPDLNPTEWLWRYLKNVRMANTSSLDLEELHENFHLAVATTRHHPKLIRSFFKSAGLKLH